MQPVLPDFMFDSQVQMCNTSYQNIFKRVSDICRKPWVFQDEDTYFQQIAKCFQIRIEHKNLIEPLFHVVALFSNIHLPWYKFLLY